MSVIDIQSLDVVFGNRVDEALSLLDQGYGREEIIARTETVVGVQDATLSVNEGEICVLMGLSGSGKSSLLRAVNGLNPISRGTLNVMDGDAPVDMATCSASTLRHMRANRVSMVFQKFALMPWLSVVDNVAFGLAMKKVPLKERRKSAMEKLEMVGLAEWAESKPHELSGGMQQRVGLARAFAMDTDILLMDEPFSALDPLIRNQLQDELIELQQNLKKTILFVSHDLDEALKLGSHIAIMESARIIQHGRPEDIVLNPETEYVENFVSHTNPLNVLMGETLMTPVTKLDRTGNRYVVSPMSNLWVEVEDGKVMRAGQGESVLPIIDPAKSEVRPRHFVTASSEISMREAINLRYQSKLPVLVVDDGMFVGILSDNNFYYALLGKHFTN